MLLARYPGQVYLGGVNLLVDLLYYYSRRAELGLRTREGGLCGILRHQLAAPGPFRNPRAFRLSLICLDM